MASAVHKTFTAFDMFTKILAITSAFAFVAAAPSGTPAGFDKVYRTRDEFPRTNFTGQGQHYDLVHSAAIEAARKLEGLGGPVYGPGSYVDDSDALKWYNADLSAGTSGVQPSNTYKCFSGSLADYPPRNQWMNFKGMFALNQRNAMALTGRGSPQGPDSNQQQTEIYNAILSVSQASKVDPRLILAVIIQESGGWVWVPCTGSGGYNCGLMQANHGSVSYNPGNSQASINQMVIDGTEGTTQGPGYVQYLNGGPAYGYTHCQAANPYAAARAYNTGSCSTSGNMNCAQYGTASYTNDIANRLIGWDGTGLPQSRCGFLAVGCV